MSVYDINGNVLQSVCDVAGNPLVQCYDINGNELMGGGIVFDDTTTVTNVYTSTINSYPQGGCMDDEGNLCACLLTTSQFVKHNILTGNNTLYSFTPDAYGHGNGMAYNPTNERFYLASMKNTGEVYVFNKSFELVDTLYARDENGNIFNCWNLAYNRNSHRFVTMSNGIMYFMDDNFEYIAKSSYAMDDWKYARQDIETDGNYIYAVSYDSNAIFVFDFQGNTIKEISNTGFTGEPENLCYDWTSNFYMSGKDSYFVIRKVAFIET